MPLPGGAPLCYDLPMQHEVVTTTRDLRVISASDGVHELSARGAIQADDHLLTHFPTLEPLLNGDAEILLDSHRVRLVTAGDQLAFVFTTTREIENEVEALRKHSRLLESIIEEAPVGIILADEGGIIEYLNRKQEQNTQKKREQLYQHDIRDVYRKTFEHPEVIDMFEKLISGSDPNPSAFVDHYNPQFYRRDMIIKFLGRRLREHRKVAVFVEIEEELYRQKRRAEKAGEDLRLSQTYLTQLLDASPNMVISVDGRRNILSFNRTAEQLLGYRAEEVYNTPADRFFPREDLPKLLLAVSAQVPWFGTFHILHADGTSFPVELSSTKITDGKTGRDIATLLLAVDIRERNRLRKNLIQSQKMTFIGELVSGLAHQLNNPLVGVVNIADVLMRAMDEDDERLSHVRMIKEAGESCREVIARLLRFSRRQEDTPLVDIDLAGVLDAGIDLLRRHPGFKGVQVEKRFDEVPVIRGDPVLLQQAFINMLVNGAQAIDGGGLIRVECRPEGRSARQIMVTIADDGCGIAEEDLPRVFEPFFSTKEADDGTGIGLSLAYWIIQDHGGRISVESAPGRGTTFTVHLPVRS
ncbi:MAG TPA: ATP-binding protein [Deltaproteobacteria bacterium]|nr:ATP-binding protein [Deltaproteobacteria bacterium]HPA76615.1 ATP-binding protein [Deltaproteobacteria bacterium]